ncbi:UNVERIFIED_CONTAM: hypothetical protein Sradi_7124400 [Sesamum radiatum]|uniref:Uncharacterized protein n=1 Tax=Sesamum radiatum TaxID=300843 RepID=A0AAW2J0E4_SESRA
MNGLRRFAFWSGLEANLNKSQLILSKSAMGLRVHLFALLGFQEGILPVKHLGFPLINLRLAADDCKLLLLKVDERLKGLGKLQLSLAAQVQLLQSVISALNIYWAMAFKLPKGIIKPIEAHMHNFLWQGGSDSRMAKVSWKDVFRPRDEGGQEICALEPLNRALMSALMGGYS